MFFPDVLKLLNRLGVRQVNDVTAQVTAEVTAGMDPEGMGAHMGAGLQVAEAVPFDQSVLLDAIASNSNNILTNAKYLHETAMKHVDKKVKKESDARKKAIKDVEVRLALLELGAACSKRPRSAPYEAPRQTRNITSNKSHDSFGWVKMVKGVSNGVKGFSSAEEAALDMERFYAGAMPGGM